MRLPVTDFSVLELRLCTEGHVFGALVLQLLRIRTTIQRLKVVRLADMVILFSTFLQHLIQINCPQFTFMRYIYPNNVYEVSRTLIAFILSSLQTAGKIVTVMKLATGETNNYPCLVLKW